jgi:hypothetical protein
LTETSHTVLDLDILHNAVPTLKQLDFERIYIAALQAGENVEMFNEVVAAGHLESLYLKFAVYSQANLYFLTKDDTTILELVF